jgi:hypothetical protein
MKLKDLTPKLASALADSYLQELTRNNVEKMNTYQMNVVNGLYSFNAYDYWLDKGDYEQASRHADIVKECKDALEKYLENICIEQPN